jgi:hypothetical protein
LAAIIMKKVLKISILLNLVLAGTLQFKMGTVLKVGVPPTTAPVPPPIASAPATPSAIMEKPQPFQWSQLFSANDYRLYVNRLRSIGCPEGNVRDIVWGDADRAFSKKRHELNLDGHGTGTWSEAAERQLVASLLGDAGLAEGGSKLADPGQSEGQPVEAASQPLVFQPVDVAALGFNDDQMEAVEQVRQQFIDAVGGTNQDPADPNYLKRWQQAQKKMDVLARGQLGGKAYMQYELAVLRAQQAAAQP